MQRQVGFAFHRIETALSMLVTNLSDLSGLAAKTERIDALFKGVLPLTISNPSNTPAPTRSTQQRAIRVL